MVEKETPMESAIPPTDGGGAVGTPKLPEAPTAPSKEPTEAKVQTVVSSVRPNVPSLTHTLPLDSWSVDEGRRLGYCR